MAMRSYFDFIDELIAFNPFKDAPGTGFLGEVDIANTF
jgi:hypothetical protein